MPGILSRLFSRETPKKSRSEIIDDIDTIAREAINRNTRENTFRKSVIVSADRGGSESTVAIGKLKKTLAPTRSLLNSGIYSNKFNMSDVYAAYIGENLIKFTVDKYVEAVVRSGYIIKSKNPSVVQYINKRLREIAFVAKISFEEYIADYITSLILYGNVYAVRHRQEDASSGKRYINTNKKEMIPIASLYVEDPRKLIIGEGPGGRMRYVRVSYDVSEIDLNNMNPSLFTTAEEHQTGIPFFHSPMGFGGFGFGFGFGSSNISRLFKVTPKRDVDYVVYEDYEISHIRYRHVPGEKISMPPFWPTLNDIDSLRRIEENIELLVYNYGHPILHAKIGEADRTGTDDEVQAVQSKLESMESNGFITTTNRVLINMIGAESAALRVDSYLAYFQKRVLTGLWLSEVAIGIGDTSNRSTANVLDKLAQEKVRELQRAFVSDIDNVFIELLLETGADLNWILHPDNMPTFEFNEIDLEGKIRKEAHLMTMWQSNMITADEMRIDLGRDPLTEKDWDNTFTFKVAIPLKDSGTSPTDAGARSTQRNLAPKNQHGTAGPKKGINKSATETSELSE
jgi:hypothetical protein